MASSGKAERDSGLISRRLACPPLACSPLPRLGKSWGISLRKESLCRSSVDWYYYSPQHQSSSLEEKRNNPELHHVTFLGLPLITLVALSFGCSHIGCIISYLLRCRHILVASCPVAAACLRLPPQPLLCCTRLTTISCVPRTQTFPHTGRFTFAAARHKNRSLSLLSTARC